VRILNGSVFVLISCPVLTARTSFGYEMEKIKLALWLWTRSKLGLHLSKNGLMTTETPERGSIRQAW
jgi:hypothetical protein